MRNLRPDGGSLAGNGGSAIGNGRVVCNGNKKERGRGRREVHFETHTIGGRRTHNSAKHAKNTMQNISAPAAANKHLRQTGSPVNRGESVLQTKAIHKTGAEAENPRNEPPSFLTCGSVRRIQPIVNAVMTRVGPRANTNHGSQARRGEVRFEIESDIQRWVTRNPNFSSAPAKERRPLELATPRYGSLVQRMLPSTSR